MRVSYAAGALRDMEQAEAYYYTIAPILAEKFMAMVAKTENEIASVIHFQLRYDEIRCRKMHVFPFMFHYVVISEDEIVVYGIIHTSMNPDENWFYGD